MGACDPRAVGLWRSRFWTPATKRARLTGVRIHDLRSIAVALWIAPGPKLAIVAEEKGGTAEREGGGRTPTRTADLCRVKAAL